MTEQLLCSDADMLRLVVALAADKVPAVLMERTGTGWRVEYLHASDGPAVAELLRIGVVQRAP